MFKSRTFGLLVVVAVFAFLNILLAAQKNNTFKNVLGETTVRATPTPAVRQLTAAQLREGIKDSYTSANSPYDNLLLEDFRNTLPYSSSNLEIAYDREHHVFLVALKNERQETYQELNDLLKKSNILRLYLDRPSNFVVRNAPSTKPLADKARNNLEESVQKALDKQNVRGIAVNAQTQTEVRAEDPTIPDQGDTKIFTDFLVDMLKGVPDDTDVDLSKYTPGGAPGGGGPGGGNTGGAGGPVGPVTPQDPPGLAAKINIDGFDYYQLPESPDGTYEIYSCPARRYGRREMIQVLYSVAKRYREMTNGADSIWVGDINASGHKSHNWGVAVDLATTGMGSMMDSDGYNSTFAKYLGEAFVSTGMIKNIWYCDQSVVDHVTAIARDRNLPLEQMYCIAGHRDHFHVDINSERGPWHTPSC